MNVAQRNLKNPVKEGVISLVLTKIGATPISMAPIDVDNIPIVLEFRFVIFMGSIDIL